MNVMMKQTLTNLGVGLLLAVLVIYLLLAANFQSLKLGVRRPFDGTRG